MTECDRCAVPTPATETVRCWYGCNHQQCAQCAKQTAKEANEE
jgi:hypothetical protein